MEGDHVLSRERYGEEPERDAAVAAAGFDPYEDVEWHGWPARHLLDWIAGASGEVEDSAPNGPCLVLDPGREGEILAAFGNACGS